jgi:hypothetical protein
VQILEYSGEELEHLAGEFFIPVIVRTRPDFRERVALRELSETRPSLGRIGGRCRRSGPTGWQRGLRQTT